MRIEEYAPDRREVWDAFVSRAKNGVFLFDRAYMDYHSERFRDASLLVYEDDRAIALLPASAHGERVVSHGGLTFGGFLTDERMRTATMLGVFERACEHLRDRGFRHLVYKAIPHIYHSMPAEEDLYALFRADASLTCRAVSTTIRTAARPKVTKGRKWAIKRARTLGVRVERSIDFEAFMRIEEENLGLRHGVRPVHTVAEMRLLAERFPDNIKLFAAATGAAMLGGVVVYESANVAHTQYIAATEAGREVGALDAVVDHLLDEVYGEKRYFDFGISTDHGGRNLNEGLAANKESFGGRAVVYDTYELAL